MSKDIYDRRITGPLPEPLRECNKPNAYLWIIGKSRKVKGPKESEKFARQKRGLLSEKTIRKVGTKIIIVDLTCFVLTRNDRCQISVILLLTLIKEALKTFDELKASRLPLKLVFSPFRFSLRVWSDTCKPSGKNIMPTSSGLKRLVRQELRRSRFT